MRPTALGVKASIFYLLLVGAFFAAPYANHFFLLLAFLTILGGLSLFWGWRNATRLDGKVTAIEAGPAGTGLSVRWDATGGKAACLELEIEDRGRLVVHGRLPEWPRGLYKVRAARVVSTWPLGLLRFARPVDAPSEIVVYPVPAVAGDAAGGGAGDEGIAQHDGMLQPSSVREYRAGDEIRRVHWKASARRGELVVQEWDGGHGRGPELVLDQRCDAARLERALSEIAGLALTARESKETLTLHTQGMSASFGSEHKPWLELLRFLAAAQPLSADAPAPPPVSPSVPRLPR